MLRFANVILNFIDRDCKLSGVVPLVTLSGIQSMPWRTRAEQAASPNSAPVSIYSRNQPVVSLTPALQDRGDLGRRAKQWAEDFTVLLRRQVRP